MNKQKNSKWLMVYLFLYIYITKQFFFMFFIE